MMIICIGLDFYVNFFEKNTTVSVSVYLGTTTNKQQIMPQKTGTT